jgi:hypothetical protein
MAVVVHTIVYKSIIVQAVVAVLDMVATQGNIVAAILFIISITMVVVDITIK